MCVLDAIADFDPNDMQPEDDQDIFQRCFKQYLKPYGLRGKRLGTVRNPFCRLANDFLIDQTFENHFKTLR